MALLSTKTGLPSFSAVDASIVNYFADPGFERGTDGTLPSGWLQYNDGAVAVPVDGTGGSANVNVTLLTTTAGAIRGTKSALLTKGPGNQQGTGYSYDFTIANPDKGVTAGVDFELVTSAAYVSGDVVFYIYDVTNSILITPRAVSLPALPNYGRFFSDYGLQTGTQYRFILHIATTNASAWTMTLDTMTNSTTRTAVPGAPITEENDYILGSFVNTPPASTLTLLWAKWRQVGNFMQCRFKLVVQTFNYSGSAQAGNSIVIDRIIPPGYTIAPEIVPAATRNGFGSVSYYFGNGGSQNANSYADGFIEYDSASGGYRFFANQRDNAALSVSDSSVQWGYFGNVGSGANNGYIQAEFLVPIVQFTGAGTNGPASVTQWASDDGTSDVLGPQGSLVPNVGFGTGTTTRVFSFSVPQDLRQFVRVEYNRSGNGWGAAADLYPFSGGNNAGTTNFYGVRGEWTSSTNFQVSFGNQGTRVNSSAVSNGTDSWATEFSGGSRFRVGLSIGGVFIGVNLAQGNFPGFYQAGQAPGYTGGAAIPAGFIGELRTFTNRTVTGTLGTWAVNTTPLDTLTPGVWLVSVGFVTGNSAATSYVEGAVSTNNSVDGTGIITSSSVVMSSIGTAANNWSSAMRPVVVNTATSQALYAKSFSEDAAQNATIYGSAIRIA